MMGSALAQAGGAGGGPPALVSFLPLLLVFVVFYFLLIRPQQQKAKQHRTMLANLKKNDEVVTSGGLYGKVIALSDHVVTLEIAPNIKVRVSRPQIGSLTSPSRTEEKDKGKERDK